jgi:hypothetical protein
LVVGVALPFLTLRAARTSMIKTDAMVVGMGELRGTFGGEMLWDGPGS